ncbi:hypothetical protein RB195_011234 [Necator americanus]|uniref:SCP domain-containing protein n=1 Tax=Necator americanus TaxID=51031 RepID=A0ABR1D2U4_NECAM
MRVENRVHAKRACAIGLMHSASEDVRALPNALRSSDDVAKRQCDVWETWEYQNGPNKGQTRCGARLFYGGGERQWRTDRPPPTRPVSTHASDEQAANNITFYWSSCSPTGIQTSCHGGGFSALENPTAVYGWRGIVVIAWFDSSNSVE